MGVEFSGQVDCGGLSGTCMGAFMRKNRRDICFSSYQLFVVLPDIARE